MHAFFCCITMLKKERKSNPFKYYKTLHNTFLWAQSVLKSAACCIFCVVFENPPSKQVPIDMNRKRGKKCCKNASKTHPRSISGVFFELHVHVSKVNAAY